MLEVIAAYTDGSGNYEISVDEDHEFLHTVIKTHDGEVLEEITQALSRNETLDTVEWNDWFLGSRFASNGDTGAVLIDGAGYSTRFLKAV